MEISHSFDIDDTFAKIKFNINHYNPKKIISLGDSFHETSTLKIIDKNYIENLNKFFSKI